MCIWPNGKAWLSILSLLIYYFLGFALYLASIELWTLTHFCLKKITFLHLRDDGMCLRFSDISINFWLLWWHWVSKILTNIKADTYLQSQTLCMNAHRISDCLDQHHFSENNLWQLYRERVRNQENIIFFWPHIVSYPEILRSSLSIGYWGRLE